MNRGEVRWYVFRPPDKRRPVLVLARDEVVDSLGEVIVVPATRTIRGLTTEVVLTQEDGMPVPCAFNFDHVSLAQKGRLGAMICALPPDRWTEVRAALLIGCGFVPD
jgi:mRNA interferase MazF